MKRTQSSREGTRPRRQNVSGSGFEAVKFGAPSRFSDLYYLTMEMSWPAFVGAVATVFISVNLIFGVIYAAVPGAIVPTMSGWSRFL